MANQQDGGPAFPQYDGSQPGRGMTLRDYFAAKALEGIVTTDADETKTEEQIAISAYALADAMLAARAR